MSDDGHLPPIDEGHLEDAMEMNRKLKAMLREMESQGMRAPSFKGELPTSSGRVAGSASSGGAGHHRRAPSDASGGIAVKSTIDMSAPAAGPLRPLKSNFTFNDDKLVDISKGNHRLMDKLTKISTSKSTIPGAAASRGPAVASATINRRKAANKIQADNEVRRMSDVIIVTRRYMQ